MSGQYLMLAGKQRSGNEETFVCHSGKMVSSTRAKSTGLFDADGREIFRIKNPIGFHLGH